MENNLYVVRCLLEASVDTPEPIRFSLSTFSHSRRIAVKLLEATLRQLDGKVFDVRIDGDVVRIENVNVFAKITHLQLSTLSGIHALTFMEQEERAARYNR